MTVLWIPGNLLAAPTPAVMAGAIDTPGSPVRALLDSLYDNTDFASQAEATTGTHAGVVMSPLRSRQAFDAWFPDAYTARRGTIGAEVAVLRMTAGAETIASASSRYALSVGTWTLHDPAGIITTVSSSLVTVAKSGLYRLSASFAGGNEGHPETDLEIGWAVPVNGPSSSPDTWFGGNQVDKAGPLMISTSEPPIGLAAGHQVGLVVKTSNNLPVNQSHRNRCRIVIERLGALDGHALV